MSERVREGMREWERGGVGDPRNPTQDPELSTQDPTIELPGPVDVAGSVEMLRRNGDDLVDRWDGVHLVRTVQVNGRPIAYACTLAGTFDRPVLQIAVEDEQHREAVEQAVRTSFVLPPQQFGDLLATDPLVARVHVLFPGIRPVLQHDLLSALVRCISAQQVNLTWAATTRRRLAEAFGDRHEVAGHTVYSLNAEHLAAADPAEIRALQFTTRKAEYLVAVAVEVASGRLDLDKMRLLRDEEIISRLTAIRGIGLWTAEWILARTMGRPRVVAGDLGVRKAVGLGYLGTPLPPEADVRAATAHWGDSGGVVQQLLLHALVHNAL